MIVHGYRSDALEKLGLGEQVRREIRPGLVDVSLDAYGHTGPWAARRGFDSLVQMSSGIAEAGMRAVAAEAPDAAAGAGARPRHRLPRGGRGAHRARRRVRKGRGWRGRLSLARTAVELENARGLPRASHFLDEAELPADPLATPWGRALLLHPPLELGGVTLRWEHAPRRTVGGTDAPRSGARAPIHPRWSTSAPPKATRIETRARRH